MTETRAQGNASSNDTAFGGWPGSAQWAALLAASAFFGAGLELAGLPAALLLGPMIAAVIVAVLGATITVPKLPYCAAQGTIACLVAASITPSILSTFLSDWPIYIAVVFSVLGASSALGYLMSRWHILPGTTAVWGSSPGAATAMMLMAEAFGADARLVAFMQYLRVIFVAVAASLMARFWIDGDTASVASQIVWFPAIVWPDFATTVAFSLLAVVVGHFTNIPAGALLVPMALGVVLNLTGLVHFQLPEWFLVAGYAVLGWKIGLGFTREVLGHALHALPKIVGSILVLLTFCGGLAALLVYTLGVDPVTAYLATSPGGMDSIAIIAASTQVDLPFVMALQTVRFVIVLIVGPPIARFIANRTR